MRADIWICVIAPFQKCGWNEPRSSFSNPTAMKTERLLWESPLKKQVEQAQTAFDDALALVMAGETPRVVSEAEWRRISGQAVEPMRREKRRVESEKRRAKAKENGTYLGRARQAARTSDDDGETAALVPVGATEHDDEGADDEHSQ